MTPVDVGIWSDPAWAAIAETLRERAGLVFSSNRRAAAETGMRRAMERAAIRDPKLYADTVAQGGAALDDLLAELTIGETYFFREPAQFEFLRTVVVPSFRKSGRGRPMRVWSAACATGEETYSIAITLAESGVASSVIGTDVSHERLAAARRGHYRKWSLRGVADPVIERYFRLTGPDYVLAPEVRRGVDFGYLNLAEDVYPSLRSGVCGMDLVFCRNVLIYFDHETIARVASRMLRTLSHDGWLLVGASDPPLQDYVHCDVVRTGGGLAYRQPRVGVRPSRPTPIAPFAPYPDRAPLVPLMPRTAVPQLAVPATAVPNAVVANTNVPLLAPQPPSAEPPVVAAPVVEPPFREPPPVALPDVTAVVAAVTALANRGELAEAARACADALDRHRDVPELHYLEAVLLAETGNVPAAAAAARRALYLDRGMIVAHLALGSALARSSRRADADRSFATAERLLDALPGDAIVPNTDGERAGRLLAMARVQRTLLSRVVV